MTETLKNVKTLFLGYTSIIFLLFIAVLQSNQDIYESALDQLGKIERLATAYDDDAIVELIQGKLPGVIQEAQGSFLLETLGLVVTFSYTESTLDYSSVKGKLDDSPSMGFNFGVSNQDRFPNSFTKVRSVRSILFKLPRAKTIATYEALHDHTLEDVRIPSLSPSFSIARVEAYRYVKNTYNSIEIVNTNEYEGYRIFDPVSLTVTDKKESAGCQLELVKTEINDRHAFICDIGQFTLDGVEYSGARIIVKAHQDSLLLERQELMNLLSTKSTNQVPFSSAYKELSDVAGSYSHFHFDAAREILEAEKSRNADSLSFFGTNVRIRILTSVAFPILIIVCLYLYLHLQEALRRISGVKEIELGDVSWIGIYAKPLNSYAVFVQLVLFPAALMIVIQFKSQGLEETVVAWSLWFVLTAINIGNFSVVIKIRDVVYKS